MDEKFRSVCRSAWHEHRYTPAMHRARPLIAAEGLATTSDLMRSCTRRSAATSDLVQGPAAVKRLTRGRKRPHGQGEPPIVSQLQGA